MFKEGILYILYHWIVNYKPYPLIYSMKKKTEGLPLEYAENWKIHIFHIYILNMDFSLIMKHTGMKTAMHVAETHWEGRVSQNFDIVLSFCFILCIRVNF